ncbi:MAG TPA: hypothetical protein VGC41_13815, partial [Kofleriaceae bacterium]
MALHFVRMRRVDGCEDYDSPEPWLAGLALDARERAQLVFIAQLADPALTADTIFTGAFRAFERAMGLAEVPIEWWDVEDDA